MPIRYDLYLASFGASSSLIARSIKGNDSYGSMADPDPNPARLGWADNDEKLGLMSIRA